MAFMDFFRRGREQRANAWWLSFQDYFSNGVTHAGTEVTEATAPQLPAVYRCWSLNSETVSSLPVDVFVKRGKKREAVANPAWIEQPNDLQDWGQFICQGQLSYEANGNIFLLKSTDKSGRLVGLTVLHPKAVEPVVRDGLLMYDVTLDSGAVKPFAATEIVHIRGLVPPGHLRGLSPIGVALKQTIGTGFAAEQFAGQFFGTGATMSGIVQVPATAGLFGEEEAKRLVESMTRKHGGINKSHAIGVLTGGAEWKQLSVTPEESQFLLSRRYTDVQVAHVHGCPPEYVTEVEGAKGYVTGLYARQAMWALTGINPRLVRWERALTPLLPKGHYLKFNRNAFLAMDPEDRVTYYGAGMRDRWLVPNEVRALEDLDPLPGGDEALRSVQWQDDSNGLPTKEPAEYWTINEKRREDGLPALEGGDAVYLPASEIPAIEVE